MAIVKKNLRIPIVLMIVGLALLFYINIGNIVLFRQIYDVIFVEFKINTLLSIGFKIAKILFMSIIIVICLKKLEDRSSYIENEEMDNISGMQGLLRKRYYYAHKTCGYFLYYLGWFGVIVSSIGNVILLFKYSNSLIFTILIIILLVIPLEVFIIKMLNKNLVFVKKIMNSYK